MSKEVNESLRKIAKGTGIVFLGLFGGLLFGFFTRIIIVRNLTSADYGIFSLVTTIVLLSFSISILPM